MQMRDALSINKSNDWYIKSSLLTHTTYVSSINMSINKNAVENSNKKLTPCPLLFDFHILYILNQTTLLPPTLPRPSVNRRPT